MKSILIHGQGGQGIKLLSKTLAFVMTQLNKQVTLTYEYDSNVRGGLITAYLKYDDKKILNPLIEEADYLILLTKGNGLKAKTTIVEKDIIEEDRETKVIIVPFQMIAKEQLKNLRLMNMVTLGYILKILNINIKKLNLEEALPVKLLAENLKAIEEGYVFTERSEK